MLNIFIAFGAGSFFGIAVTVLLYKIFSSRKEKELSSALDFATERLKASFGEISQRSLSVAADHMIKLASEKLGSERELSVKEVSGQKSLIEARVAALNGELDKLTSLVNDMESKRSRQMGELQNAIAESGLRAAELYKVTHGLKEVLSSKQRRGQWAERMAGDILNFAGLKEGISYKKQSTDFSTGNRPDFTFFLPNGMKLNMDVKFPFENYEKYMQEEGVDRKAFFKKEFLKDVKNHIKAVSSREYINPEDNTVDCVLLFIPNESVYGLIFDTDISVLEEAGSKNVLICSPVTILSVLAIIRQAADNFVMAGKAKELLGAIGVFRKEWLKYSEGFEKLGVHIDRMSKDYNELKTTRTNKLESSIGRLESLDENKQD